MSGVTRIIGHTFALINHNLDGHIDGFEMNVGFFKGTVTIKKERLRRRRYRCGNHSTHNYRHCSQDRRQDECLLVTGRPVIDLDQFPGSPSSEYAQQPYVFVPEGSC